MNHCIVIGQPNVGKTLLSFRLAKLCGMKSVFVIKELLSDVPREQVMIVNEAVQTLVNGCENSTVGVQTIGIGMSQTMGQPVLLYDTVGLSEDAGMSFHHRHGMARTLQLFISCDLVFHVVDASTLHDDKLHSIDDQIYSLAKTRKVPYVLIMNKMDLLSTKRQRRLEGMLRRYKAVFISAKYDQGVSPLKHVLERTNMVNYSYAAWMRGN